MLCMCFLAIVRQWVLRYVSNQTSSRMHVSEHERVLMYNLHFNNDGQLAATACVQYILPLLDSVQTIFNMLSLEQ